MQYTWGYHRISRNSQFEYHWTI